MAEKSLDDPLKEIQIAREQAELEKLKEETALVRQQVNAKWYSGSFSSILIESLSQLQVIDKLCLVPR